MKNHAYFRYFIVAPLLILFLFCGCGKKNAAAEPAESSRAVEDIAPAVVQSRRSVAVVLNSELGDDNIAAIQKQLGDSFGMIDAGGGVLETGFITFFMYPEDFTREGIVRVSDIRQLAEDPRIRALVLVVPPRYIGNYLPDIKKARPDIALMAALPESEILPMEAWCDVVLSFALPSAETEETPPEEEAIQPAEIARMVELLVNTVRSSELVQSTSQLLAACKRLAAQPAKEGQRRWIFTNYKDPDSGLKATNHFVIMQDRDE